MEKNYEGPEKRRFKRIVFSAKDEVMGLFTFPKVSVDLIPFKIADLSAGGLQFFVFRDDDLNICTGDKFLLKKIKGKTNLAFVTDSELEVKWVMDHEMFNHIMIGCEFLNISEAIKTRIDQFVLIELSE